MKHKILLVLFLSLFFVLASCGESQTTTPSAPTPMATPTLVPTPTPEPHHQVGDTVVRDGFEISLTSAKTIDPATIPQHEQIFPSVTADQTFLVLSERVKNISTQDQAIAGMQFVLQDDAGQSNFSVQLGVPGVDIGIGGPIAPAMKQVGSEAYIVPKATHHLFMVYESTVGTQVIWDINL